MESISIKEVLSKIPIGLDINNEDSKKAGEFLLPYSIGIEVECNQKDTFNLNDFTSIPYIMEVDADRDEQRFRIPSGIKGLHCLYNISLALRKNSELNPLSGIHYHVDFTDVFEKLTKEHLNHNQDWILKELDTWQYAGSYNSRRISFKANHTWIRTQKDFKTLECRIGEMTFDYQLLFKRITHLSDIMRKLKIFITKDYYENLKIVKRSEIEDVLKNRTIKI